MLKYTGSKRWLTRVLRPMEESYEPFAGSGGVSFRKSNRCYLNDTVAPLIETYRQLKVDQTGFVDKVQKEIDRIKKSKSPKSAYYDVRKRFNQGGLTDPVLFCVILYLGFNGLWRVGPNGCNVPYGGDSRAFSSSSLLAIPVNKICSLTNFSWEVAPVPNEACVIYADPPYATAYTGYTTRGWTHADNVTLFGWLSEKPNPVLLSCLQTPDNEKLLKDLGFDYLTMPKTFSNGVKSVKKREILAFNDEAVQYVTFREFNR